MEKITSENYIEYALKTKAMDYDKIRERLNDEVLIDLLHAGIGLATEAGEFLDGLKKYVFYGKSLDATNLVEEAGDSEWYIAIALDRLHVKMNAMLQINIDKLATRYPNKFTEDSAINRDLDAERKILEQENK